MIRPTTPEDVPAIVQLTAETGFFKPMEIDVLGEVLSDYFRENRDLGHHCVTLVNGMIEGFAYFAPADMTEGSWYLYWIAVSKNCQGRGLGAQLLRHAEAKAKEQGGRVLFIETSSQVKYDPTRKFYLAQGYDHEATLRDFYAAGDDMVVFRKPL